jgi:hypothetical protein
MQDTAPLPVTSSAAAQVNEGTANKETADDGRVFSVCTVPVAADKPEGDSSAEAKAVPVTFAENGMAAAAARNLDEARVRNHAGNCTIPHTHA